MHPELGTNESELSGRIQEQSEMLAQMAITMIPKGDYGFLYVIFKNLSTSVGKELKMPDILAFNL